MVGAIGQPTSDVMNGCTVTARQMAMVLVGLMPRMKGLMPRMKGLMKMTWTMLMKRTVSANSRKTRKMMMDTILMKSWGQSMKWTRPY